MDDDCQILDVNIDIGGRVIYTSKLIAEVDPPSLFAEIVTEAIEEYAQSALNLSDIDEDADEEDLNEDDPIKVEAQRLIALIKSIKCTGRDRSAELLKFLQKSSITLKSLHSISSPIFRTGITIKIGKPKAPMASSDPKPKVNPFAIMMGAENAKELRFITPPPQQLTPNLDVQIRTGLYEHLIHIKLGYYNPDQKYVLETNVGKITNALCMIEKHWHKFFYKEFPNISEKCFNYSLIQLTAQCNRNTARKSEKLKIELVISHITALTTLSWTMFSSAKAIKKSLDVFKGDIAKVCSLLTDKKLSMLGHNSILSQKPVTKVFKSLPSYVQLDEGNNEFYVSIPPSTKKHSKQRGQPSAKMTSIRHAIKSIAQSLRHSEDYVVRHITDEEMGIIDEAFLCEGGTVSLTSADRTFYRTSFKTELAKGLDGLCISLFGRSSSIGPSCLFVWKTPMLHGDAHAGNVQLAINECRDILPKKVSAESARHFNNILRGIAKVPAKVRAALTSYLFGGELNVTGDDADTYYEFVENLAGGLPIDDSWIVDGRAFNSRGGKGINSTKFEEFWEVCRSIILPTATTEERRHNGCLHASAVLSIPDLRRQAIESLENKVKQNVLAVMPPVPSIEWVRLQFVPSNDTVNKAAQMSGRLGCKRAAQKRTLRKAHVDQHWVNAMTRYILLWLIELKKATDGVLFLGQDDKAKIPVGDSVPISTGVRANVRRSIVNADTEDSLTAMDHDFHVVNLVCSATLVCNIPDSIGGSFFMGDEESGNGEMFYTLRDAIFDPSTVFDHTAQLIDCLRRLDKRPFVLVLQTDGGPDHSIKFANTKNAMVALFVKLDLDHLVVLRGAPNGSAYNKIERLMSPANFALTNVSTKRGVMPDWAEKLMKNCNAMAEVRKTNERQEKERERARARIVQLDELKVRRDIIALVTEYVQAVLREMVVVQQNPMNLILETVESVATISKGVLAFIGIDVDEVIDLGDVSADIAMEEGQRQTRSTTITRSVITSQREKAVEISEQDFRAAYDASIKEPMDAIGSRLKRVVVSGKSAHVTPRVGPSVEKELHEILLKIDPLYDKSYRTAEEAKKMPALVAWYAKHVISHPYCLSIQKCNDVSCCQPCRSPAGIRPLVMQRQPTPRLDDKNPQRNNHFLSRDEALRLFEGKPKAVTDLTDLPSKAMDEAKHDQKEKGNRDKEVNIRLKLRSWDHKKVRSTVICFHCNKPRCIFSRELDDEYYAAAKVLKRTMESISGYSCGDLIFDDNDPISDVLAQRQNLTCESKVETAYYNVDGRSSFVTVPVCIHCGERGSSDFLLQQSELEARNKTGGKQCYPICIECLEDGRNPVPRSNNANKSQKRKEDRASKTAEAAKRKKAS
eukprot:scaffold227870_cov37-Cyclotella_meneghiniana.AAC.2